MEHTLWGAGGEEDLVDLSSLSFKLEGSQRSHRRVSSPVHTRKWEERGKSREGEKVSATATTQWQNTTTYGEFLLLSHCYKSRTKDTYICRRRWTSREITLIGDFDPNGIYHDLKRDFSAAADCQYIERHLVQYNFAATSFGLFFYRRY